ncbi:uncharacterized protein N7515_002745 [Penicillium bovifimosum]|uniref:Uncharacterized protein n=1 Tax=Penicillium bovifimosum TaxID=126998 RepID=A0A9W9L9J8_9EURO|nr:uncharacterized protein N7515_002745 [Penicillium bovifimosum]KAJ5143958.1 hypothetical protein N7515_002745 [Penicillium bovifimosum]
MEFTSTSGGFGSRRSYPSLNHVSLAPLTPRFPIDDDDTDALDYFNHRDNDSPGSGTRTPPAPSYLASVSVPSTPPILSHSRSNSRTRHHVRSKSSTRPGPASDTNLVNHNLTHPLHHAKSHKKQPSSISSTQGRRQPLDTYVTQRPKSDAEWMLRAGIALASSTREEKGQSWLTKRETSTSLDPPDETVRHHKRTKSGSSRKSRSGASTPAFSRAASRRSSRRGSRAGLTMTTLPTTERALGSPGPGTGTATGTASPTDGRSVLLPDFVDERIRAEMASLQNRRLADEDEGFWHGEDDEDESECSYSDGSDETSDDFDEADLQRLTRERGFGLGSWFDRLVGWTLFGVEELPVAVSATGSERIGAVAIGAVATTTTVTFEEPGLVERGRMWFRLMGMWSRMAICLVMGRVRVLPRLRDRGVGVGGKMLGGCFV